MKLGIMQPYFFPYLGYYALIKYTDKFIFFDTPQYISHGWVNRNRILKQDGTPSYMIVPIRKAARETPICEIKINTDIKWKEKIYGQLTVYKKKAPRYAEIIELVHSIFDAEYGESLSELNIESIKKVCAFLGIEREFNLYSAMNLEIENVTSPDEWALNITKALGEEVYVNPPGGVHFFDRMKYKNAGITLEFLQVNLKPYLQKIGHFEEGLSIIDVMMFCSNQEILEMLEDYSVIR